MTDPSPYRPGARFRVLEAFPAGFFDDLAPTLIIRPGDRVTVSTEESKTWPAFALVTNDRGERGWVPKRCLRQDGDRALVTHDYDTTTLDPAPGEILELIEADLEGGWLRCRDPHGRIGWFPVTMVETIAH